MANRYESLGVSATKSEVHKAISNLDKGLYPNAFCKILSDIVGGKEDYCNIIHADTAGTKTSLAYLAWKETGDLSIWRGIAQDAMVMNIDDLACVGSTQGIVISSTIGRNKALIPAEVISELIQANQTFIKKMSGYNVQLISGGGETADVGDIVRTIDVGITAFARMQKKELIINNIKSGAVIVGLSSSGQSTYEDEYTSGIGSNGLTAARHEFLVYKLLCSPTRTYAPILNKIIKHCKNEIQGIIHCSGGAQTKVLKFVHGVKIIKDNLFTTPPVFQMIQDEMNYSKKELYQIYNMGHRMELYVDPSVANEIIEISKTFNVDAKIIGRVESSENSSVEINIDNEVFEYSEK